MSPLLESVVWIYINSQMNITNEIITVIIVVQSGDRDWEGNDTACIRIILYPW